MSRPYVSWPALLTDERCLQAGGCDLHLHSTASDGTLSPTQLAEAVIAADLKTVCLTDHDTLRGQAEFLEVLQRCAPEVRTLVGVELSCAYGPGDSPADVHLLAYFDNLTDARALEPYLKQQLALRHARNRALFTRLTELGLPLSDTFLKRLETDDVVGRPHFAQELVRCGHVDTVQTAFSTLLGAGRPAYLEVSRPPLGEAIAAVHAAGGLAVLAHPHKTPFFHFSPTYGLSAETLDFGRHLQALGLDGLEAWHGEASEVEELGLSALAHSLQIFRTAGSDFHGDLRPGQIYRGDRQFLRREYVVTAACLWQGEEFFLAERAPGEYKEGFYEFPGGKLERGEDYRRALQRELREELGLELDLAAIPLVPRFYLAARRDDSDLFLALFDVTMPAGAAWHLYVHSRGGFVNEKEARELNLLPLDRPLLDILFSRPTSRPAWERMPRETDLPSSTP